MCGDRLANFLSVPTAHSFRRASVGSRTGAVQSWQSARLASLRRRGFSHQSTHGPPKKHPTALAVGCFFVPLTQSGYFRQKVMAGVNPCRNGHSTKSMRHKNPKNTDFLSIVYTLRALLSISFPHFLCVGHHLFVLLGVSKAICKGKRLRFS